jgi:AcrR family transcriptional regulator
MTPVVQQGLPAVRARRADAERNRAAILEASTAIIVEQGSLLDVRQVARRSGVGMGTLYRHFSTKEELLNAALERLFISWVTLAREAAKAIDDPMAALEDFFEQTLVCRDRSRALNTAYRNSAQAPIAECGHLLDSVIDELRTRAQAAHVLRPDVTVEDLALLLTSLSQLAQTTGNTHPETWRRLLRISLDGLSSEHTEALPLCRSNG